MKNRPLLQKSITLKYQLTQTLTRKGKFSTLVTIRTIEIIMMFNIILSALIYVHALAALIGSNISETSFTNEHREKKTARKDGGTRKERQGQ